MIIAPFWRRPNHLSAVRVERFIRWLAAAGRQVVLVRAGGADGVTEQPWGVEVAVRDPLGLHPENPSESAAQGARDYSPLVTLAAALVFNPDPGILWARRAARHPLVLEHGRGAGFVLSSSPPESAHLCAAALATRLGADLIVDMRDGWLDEPLKPLLRTSRLQRWREGRLEKRVMEQAKSIFVTSPVWKEMLAERLPSYARRTVMLTNGYPVNGNKVLTHAAPSGGEELSLLYAGQLSQSRSTQRASLLLAPLLEGLLGSAGKGRIEFMGRMAQADLTEIAEWEPRFAAAGWRLIVSRPVPREEAWARMAHADGLLLLCEAWAAVPAKLYEYLAARKPVFSVSPRGSAVCRMVEKLPHVFQVDSGEQGGRTGGEVARHFLGVCALHGVSYPLPQEYAEDWLSKVFLDHVR